MAAPGIFVGSASQFTVTRNKVRSSTHAIDFYLCGPGAMCNDNVLTATADVGAAGVRVEDCDRLTVTNNLGSVTAGDIFGSGVDVNAGSVDCRVIDNDFLGAATTAVVDAGTGTDVRGNR